MNTTIGDSQICTTNQLFKCHCERFFDLLVYEVEVMRFDYVVALSLPIRFYHICLFFRSVRLFSSEIEKAENQFPLIL